MAKKVSYHQMLRQEMSGLIDQLELPEIYKQSLRGRWLDQTIWADKKADQCRRWHYRMRLTTIIGGVVLPALVGINFQVGRNNNFLRVWFPYLTFGLSQVIAVSAAIEEFCRFGDRWRQYRQMAEDLKTEGWQYLQGSGLYEKAKTPIDSYSMFASRVESIIKNDVQSYISQLMQDQAKQEQAAQKALSSAQSVASDRSLFATADPNYRPPGASYPGAAPNGMGRPASGYPANPGYSGAGYGNSPGMAAPGYGAAPAYAAAPVGYASPGYGVPSYPPDGNPAMPAYAAVAYAVQPGYPAMANGDAMMAYSSPAVNSAFMAAAGSMAAAIGGGTATLQVQHDTLFKTSPQPSQTLPEDQKVAVASGTSLGLVSFALADANHIQVTLAQGLDSQNRNDWFVYAPHATLFDQNGQPIVLTAPAVAQPMGAPSPTASGAANGEIRLNVPYFSQRDNIEQPMRTCNTSSCAMVAKYLGARINSDDEYFQFVEKYGDTTDHDVQTRALTDIGIQSSWHTNLGFEELDKSLMDGLPIVIGILHRGTLEAPTGGHMLVVTGRTASGDFICNDPFGSVMDDYATENGSGVVYPRQMLDRRWMPDGPKTGWGRLFYGNNPPTAPQPPAHAVNGGTHGGSNGGGIPPFGAFAAPQIRQWVNAEQLIQIAGAGAPVDRIRQFTQAVNETFDKFQINTPLRIAHFLAQVMHESGGFQYLREIWGPNEWQLTYEGREDLGNVQPGDGKRYMGRGLIQLTGRENYTEFSKAMNVDFVSRPELIEQPPYAVMVAGWYWNSRKINDPADRDDLEEVTRRINGGTLHIDQRGELLQRAKSILRC